MNINSDNTPETTTGMEIIARDLPSYDEGLQDVASLPFGNGTGAEDEERLPADQPRTYFSRTNKIIFGVLGGCLVVFVTGISSAAVTSSNIATSFNSSRGGSKSPKAPKSTKNPTASKQPKAKVAKVVLPEGEITFGGAADATCDGVTPSPTYDPEQCPAYYEPLFFDNPSLGGSQYEQVQGRDAVCIVDPLTSTGSDRFRMTYVGRLSSNPADLCKFLVC